VATYVIWIALDLPREVTFLIPAAFALIAWMGSWREISAVEELSAPHSFKFSKDAVLLILAFAVVIWLSQTSSVIHTHIIGQGSELDNPLYTIFGFMLPPLSWILYAYLADKGKEHIGFFLGMGLYIIGIQVAFLSGENLNALLIPLTITDGLGGSYAEFFILAAPLIFFSSSKRPVLVASLGLALDLFSAAAAWDSVYWVPEKLLMLQVETLVNAAITSVVFVVLVILLFERHKERTLAALIRKMVIKPQSVLAAPEIAETALQQEKQETAQSEVPVPVPIAERFAPEEQEIAMLLVEGYTKGEIARKLRMTSAEVGAHMMIIRGKVTGADEGSADALLAQAAANYKLTGRETQVLRGLFEGKTNVIIAEEHFISEETVKFHVKNVMKKLPVENRSQIREWVLTGEMAEIS
jgi:DNA-binding NarL/FixJ family response regulator